MFNCKFEFNLVNGTFGPLGEVALEILLLVVLLLNIFSMTLIKCQVPSLCH